MSIVKYQHYLARKHMSWFGNSKKQITIWSIDKNCIESELKPENFGGQKYLYESDELPVNYVEKEVLHSIEENFFAARDRMMEDRAPRRHKDRQAAKKYIAAQYLRTGYNHKRIVQLDKDMRFLAKEIGLEKIWQLEKYPQEKTRRHASSLLAGQLLDIDYFEDMLREHFVIFVNREEDDLLLPDSGVIQRYPNNGNIVGHGLASKEIELWLPISSDASLKLVGPRKKTRLRSREFQDDNGYEDFLKDISLNAKSFIIGRENSLKSANFSNRPCFDPNGERLSMILQLYRSGALDHMIKEFWKGRCSDIPYQFIRQWFYKEKFIPAVNKLLNPDDNPNVLTIPMQI